jgi:tRNA(fMet)-specific endonuclease VapC
MPFRYLLDTNTASYVIPGRPLRVREHLLKIPMAELAVSAVTEAELRFGAARRRDLPKLTEAVEEFLIRVEVLPWDSDAARRYAELRAALEGVGEPMGNLDLMIAAHALATGTTLVSSDRVFRRVKGLRLADWTI